MIFLPRRYRIRKIIIPGVFLFWASIAGPGGPVETENLLTPPGLRPVKDPSIVIPTDYHYPNRPFQLPAFRDAAGNTAPGWSALFVETRRFASNQSAWIYYRNSDLKDSISLLNEKGLSRYRFWPPDTTLIIEMYKGNALLKKNRHLIKIAAMSKTGREKQITSKAFHPVTWSYASFDPNGTLSMTPAKARKCHQCHSIAFHLTGDLIFSRMP